MVKAHFLCLLLLPSVLGHGNLVKPFAWWDTQRIGWWWDAEGEHSDVGCGNLDLPPTEFLEVTGNPPDCPKMWFTADAVLPEGQQATLPEYMSQPGAAAGPPRPSA